MPALYYRLLFLVLCLLPFTLNAETLVSQPAPDFSVSRLNGDGQINLAEMKGKVIYLDFWATWCPPCRKSFPWMEEMHTRYKDDGLAIVAISVDGKQELAEKFVNETKASFITAIDSGKKTAKAYKLRAMPSSYLIDRNGNIISSHLGFRTSKTAAMEAEIKSALRQ